MSWGAVIIGGTTLASGYMASQSSSKAASAQAEAAQTASRAEAYAAEKAAEAQKYAADKAQQTTLIGLERQEKLTAPWRKAGEAALYKLTKGDYTQSPGYGFRLSEGQRAISNMAAARGGLLSGATGKALARYGQDYATQDYDNFVSRNYNLAALGQASASGQAANVGAGYSNLANIQTGAGAAQAAGYLGVGQAQAAGALGVGQAQASNYLTQGQIWSNMLDRGLNAYLMWQGGGPSGGYPGVGTRGVSPGSRYWH